MATLHPLPTDGSRAPMTACRQNLANAIKALADEVEALEATERPAQRLGALGQDLAELDREIAGLKAVHETRLANWIAQGQQGERPQPSLRTSSLEARRVPANRKVGAKENRYAKRRTFPRGTDGSNPVPSSGESSTNCFRRR
jgi:hypothetical protein